MAIYLALAMNLEHRPADPTFSMETNQGLCAEVNAGMKIADAIIQFKYEIYRRVINQKRTQEQRIVLK